MLLSLSALIKAAALRIVFEGIKKKDAPIKGACPAGVWERRYGVAVLPPPT